MSTAAAVSDATARPRVILLGGVLSDRSVSMKRYARELSAALPRLDRDGWQFELLQPRPPVWLSSMWTNPQAERIESAVARYAAYPLTVRRRTAALFHVLDHAYGHLVRWLDPDRTVVTCHDLIPLLSADGRIPMQVPASVARTVRFRVNEMARASRIITISEATRNNLLEYTNISPSRVTVVKLGVSTLFGPVPSAEADAIRRALKLPAGSKVILQVATRGRYKGTLNLLRAFARVRQACGPDVTLVRVGVPLYEDEAALAERLGVTSAVRFIGTVSDDELANWYRAATVLAFPSVWEGFGWPPLESMASGTPVVASNIPAVREVVGGAADLVEPGDEQALAAALTRVLTDAAHAERLRGLGLERARALSWDETAQRTLAVYAEVAGRGPAAH